MFCPKCSQQQVSDEVRFCSRCGFQLQVVAELLKTDGALANYEPQAEENLSLYRRITSQVGTKLIFLSIILIPFETLIGIPFDTAAFLLISVILFIVGFAQTTYALIFGEKTSSEKRRQQPEYLNPAQSQFKLPSTQSEPVPILEIRNRNTSEMIPPPSVTEPTTKLLELNSETNDLKD